MSKKYLLLVVGFLLVLNVFCWQEVFVLANNKDLAVHFLDVGQGDAVFIETPEGHQIIIDGGPDSSALKQVSSLVPFWDKTLDLVILTHPEKDHMQGLIDLLQRYKADYILWTGIEKSAPEHDAWIKILEKQEKMGAKILYAEAGQVIKSGNALIATLYPFESLQGQASGASSNDTCVINKIIFGSNSFLFTGDAGFNIEKDLDDSYDKFILKSNVLKVAHHGSKYSTSEDLLENVGPEIAVISVGKNSYGHPTSETIQRLQDSGAQVLRTDQKGAITILSDGQNITIK